MLTCRCCHLIFHWLCLHVDVNECFYNPNICSNGKCENTAGSYRCVCNDGFTVNKSGKRCINGDCTLFTSLRLDMDIKLVGIDFIIYWSSNYMDMIGIKLIVLVHGKTFFVGAYIEKKLGDTFNKYTFFNTQISNS